MHHATRPLVGLCASTLIALAGCDRQPADAPDPLDAAAGAAPAIEGEATENAVTGAAASVPAAAAALPDDTLGDDASLDALVAESEIPYPVYPNGAKYRVGGENGLKIVLFETEDSFDEVDAYYSERSGEAGMPRLAAMNDYVRYAKSDDDADPWATHRPGIVIHRFDEGEREAVGANARARTNIIMSF